jgi:hypothetical protein
MLICTIHIQVVNVAEKGQLHGMKASEKKN